MSNKQAEMVHKGSVLEDVLGWFFGILFFLIGLINTFWGNDFGYGVFVVLLSFVFLPPVQSWIKKRTGLIIPWFVKVIIGAFILWSAFGVAELFAKIDLMKQELGW